MQGPTALILAGAGMLNDVARALVYDGWQVILPARRYVPVPIDRGEPPGRAVWLEAHWDQPEELAQRVAAALHGRSVDLLVMWLHDSYRESVSKAVEPLLSPTAPVVEVWSATGPTVVPRKPGSDVEDVEVGRSVQRILLGEVSAFDDTRALSQAEIMASVRAAVDRALEGAPSAQHEVGRRRPQPQIPRPRVHDIAGGLPRWASPAGR